MDIGGEISRRTVLAIGSAALLAALAPVEALASSVGSSNLPADFEARMRDVRSVLTELYRVRAEKRACKTVLDGCVDGSDDWLVAAKSYDDLELAERGLRGRTYEAYGRFLRGWELPDEEEQRKLIWTLNHCLEFEG